MDDPSPAVAVFNRQRRVKVSVAGLRRFTRALLAAVGRDGEGLHVTLLDDAEMRRLNLATFNKDRTTNVISFPLHDVPGDAAPILGDVIVSVETALREARAAGMPAEQRLAELVIHGLLHVLGYDHVGVSAAERRRMQRAEKKTFAQVAEWVTGKLILGIHP